MRARIALLVPFFTGSHQQWAEGYSHHSAHDIILHTLLGRHWKWRMHGAAVHFAQQLAAAPAPSLILTTDMCDVATLRALLPKGWQDLPIAVYFHENQLTYPWSDTDQDPSQGRDRHYGWINFTTALAADRIIFNSHYHQQAFLSALPDWLSRFPDTVPLRQAASLSGKSAVTPIGMDWSGWSPADHKEAVPIFVWNHRWEFDKGPGVFFRALYTLAEEGYTFRLVVLGESYRQAPPIFATAKNQLADRILHWGYASDRATYRQWLERSTIALVSSQQDFFGISTVEAMYAGAYPLLPDRLAFPGHLPESWRDRHIYADMADALDRLRHILGTKAWRSYDPAPLRTRLAKYNWPVVAAQLDQQLTALLR